MKKKLIQLSVYGALILFGAFTTSIYDVKKSTAEVNQEQGIYVFSDSKPVAEYEFLGNVEVSKKKQVSNRQYSGIKIGLIKQLKEKYPKANGIILHLKYGQADQADAIFLK